MVMNIISNLYKTVTFDHRDLPWINKNCREK